MLPDLPLSRSEQMVNALTVDLEDWYHGLTRTMNRPDLWSSLPKRATESTAILLDLLAEAGVRATFFILGDLAKQSPEIIRSIVENGHELGSHGYSHRRISQLTPKQFREDLARTRQLIEEISGISVTAFRAPQFSITRNDKWVFEVLGEAGYKLDSSVFPTKTMLYGYPGATNHPFQPTSKFNLMEYPVATLKFGKISIPIAGGVYNRILPVIFLLWGIRRMNRQGLPAVIYIHPWEFDLNQPRIPVNPRERVTHYIGRSILLRKIRNLMETVTFAPLGIVHQNWITDHCSDISIK
jgi:polysaccharide deacetylase family protein (PEP-CTERM system associated)